MTQALWGGLVTSLALDASVDPRGSLTPVSFAEHGFEVVRAFVVSAPDGAIRGGHGHRTGRQLLLRAGGSIELELRHAGQVAGVTLDETTRAVLVEPGVWSRQTYSGGDAALVVFCDTEYDPSDYFDDPAEAR